MHLIFKFYFCPDRDYSEIAHQIKRDLYYKAGDDDPKRGHLPPNNGMQQQAIDKALESPFSIIQGPPGYINKIYMY